MNYFHAVRVKPVHATKAGKYTIAHAAKHQLRQPSDNTDNNIDASRTHLNRQLIGDPDLRKATNNYLEANGLIEASTGKPKFASTQSDKLLAEVVLAAKAEYFDAISPGWRRGEVSTEMQKWVTDTTDFLSHQWGDKVVFAQLHLDEKAPHIHAFVVPDVTKTKLNAGRASRDGTRESKTTRAIQYNDMFYDDRATIWAARKNGNSDTATKMGRLQTEHADFMAARGSRLNRGVRNSRLKHKTHHQHRQELNRALRLARELRPSPLNVDELLVPTMLGGQKLAPDAGTKIKALVKKVNDYAAVDHTALFEDLIAYHDDTTEELAAAKAKQAELVKLKLQAMEATNLQAELKNKEATINKLEATNKTLQEAAHELRALDIRDACYALGYDRALVYDDRAGGMMFDADLFKKHHSKDPASKLRLRNAIDLVMDAKGVTSDVATKWLLAQEVTTPTGGRRPTFAPAQMAALVGEVAIQQLTTPARGGQPAQSKGLTRGG